VSSRSAAAIVVGATAIVIGIALLGQGGNPPPESRASLEEPTATSRPSPTSAVTQDRTPRPTTNAWTTAREQGRTFEFAVDDLCAWFSPEEITAIVADAYLAHGGEIVPGPFRRQGDRASCEGWVADRDGGLVQLYPGPEPSIAELPLRLEDFSSREAMSPEVRVGTLSPIRFWQRAGTSAHLAVAGHEEVLAFVHVAPDAYAGEPAAWRNLVALAIADEMLRRMDWLLSLPTGATPLPDIEGALPGDDGTGPLPVGAITEAPNPDRLDFLFELGDYRDAHWLDPEDPTLGSGVWTAGRPFHVREGFIINSADPLGAGFDVVLYVTRLEGGPDGRTYRYTSDYVLRGTSDRCGPLYKTQRRPETCEWFVHDFPDGLPEGRWAIWAVWEAPCRAWVDLGLTDACRDPDEVLSLFSSGFDAPYRQSGPDYTERSL
jgi:hypothetical protein